MKTCAIRHRELVAAPTRCVDCGERIAFVTDVAVCKDCLNDRLIEEERADKFRAALAALDRMGEGGDRG